MLRRFFAYNKFAVSYFKKYFIAAARLDTREEYRYNFKIDNKINYEWGRTQCLGKLVYQPVAEKI